MQMMELNDISSAQQVYMSGQLGGEGGNMREQCQESITAFALWKMQMD